MSAPIFSANHRWRWDGQQWIATAEPGPPGTKPRWRRAWTRILAGGSALWVLSAIVTALTRNGNLVPTVILLGSFLIPVTFVFYAFEREATRALAVQDIFIAFVGGGVIGVLAASGLESAILPHTSLTTYLWVGLIEEGCKLGALWWIARGLHAYTMRDGIVLGAAVGFGFAAFESSGYAFNALFTKDGLSLVGLVETEVLRGVLAPFGHGLWTAILGGVLFRAAARGHRLRISLGLVAWFAGIALLHAFWDSTSGIAFWLILIGTGDLGQWHDVQLGQTPPLSPVQVGLFDVLKYALLLVDGAIGLWLVRGRVRQAAADWASSSAPAPGPASPAPA